MPTPTKTMRIFWLGIIILICTLIIDTSLDRGFKRIVDAIELHSELYLEWVTDEEALDELEAW